MSSCMTWRDRASQWSALLSAQLWLASLLAVTYIASCLGHPSRVHRVEITLAQSTIKTCVVPQNFLSSGLLCPRNHLPAQRTHGTKHVALRSIKLLSRSSHFADDSASVPPSAEASDGSTLVKSRT